MIFHFGYYFGQKITKDQEWTNPKELFIILEKSNYFELNI